MRLIVRHPVTTNNRGGSVFRADKSGKPKRARRLDLSSPFQTQTSPRLFQQPMTHKQSTKQMSNEQLTDEQKTKATSSIHLCTRDDSTQRTGDHRELISTGVNVN